MIMTMMMTLACLHFVQCVQQVQGLHELMQATSKLIATAVRNILHYIALNNKQNQPDNIKVYKYF